MNRLPYLALLALLFLLPSALTQQKSDPPFPPIKNTQNPKDVPPTAPEAAAKITVPEGFRVTLFAGEPDVQQPIGMSVDDRGRLWVAECYTYSGQYGAKCWDQGHRDRLVIFEDADNDGKFDKRTIFSDKLHNLTSVAHGFGGVYALCPPHLLFIPERNGDDVPDGPPVVLLDGFNVREVGHNIANGLLWGPDGWLYGRHGIMATSLIGAPGTPDSNRAKLNCGIWRYHPTRKVAEAVCHGTTNPWGMDYDEHGQFFFTNNVNGHLWHVIPGAHYKRMYGEDLNPRVYELIDQHADHYHWDTSKSWTDSRDAKGKHGDLGGGHSHVGGLIYQGDAWPQEYRGQLFMCNTHGRRINVNKLERQGSGYVGKRAPDFLFANQPWFRGIDLKLAPDGNVYLSDWVDLGECHDHDGVHRTSGRIYKIIHGKLPALKLIDLAKLSNEELVELQWGENDYFVRTARRLLQERAAAGQDMTGVHQRLRERMAKAEDERGQLRALWALNATGGIDVSRYWLTFHKETSEHVRAWALRLLLDRGPPNAGGHGIMLKLAREEKAPLVRLALASALQRLPLNLRSTLALGLASRAEDAADHNLPLLLWYGIEPAVPHAPESCGELAVNCKIPLLRRFITRRLAEDLDTHAKTIARLLRDVAEKSDAVQLDVLRGLHESLRGRRKVRPPEAWAEVQVQLVQSPNAQVVKLARELNVVFGDGRSLNELLRVAQDANADGEARRAALRVLIEARPDNLLPVLLKLMSDRATMGVVVRGLAAFDHPDIPAMILRHYQQLTPEDRPSAVATLVARPAYARVLLQAVADGKLPRVDVTAFHARQIHNLGDAELQKQLGRVWGEIRNSSADKQQLVARYKKLLTADALKQSNPTRGQALYKQVCASCHKLFGEGENLGPDLTGGNRDNLDYLLENTLDPSAVLAADFRVSVVTLKNGRVLTGVVGAKLGKTLTVQMANEKLTLETGDIEEIQATAQSLMPEGLLQPLSDEQVRDLFGYLMKR